MTITINDLKLLESENMTNAAHGGGGASNNVIIDGMSNNIFDDISAQDRVYGKVNERKCFMGVQSLNNDKLYSAMSYISKLSGDDNITINLFKSLLWYDTRTTRQIAQKMQYGVFEKPFLAANAFALKESGATNYNFLANRAFNAFVIEANAGNKTLKLFGTDGFFTIKDGKYTPITTHLEYGANGLRQIFGNSNHFLLSDGSQKEDVIILGCDFDSYSPNTEANQDVEGITDGQGRPISYFQLTLALAYPLINTYVCATNQPATWLSCNTKLFIYRNFLDNKFYTAKKLQTAIAIGDTSIDIDSNINQVIPLIKDVNLESSVLGIDLTQFPNDGNYDAFASGDVVIVLNDRETSGTYSNNQTVTLARQNLAKVTVKDSAGNSVESNRYMVDLIRSKVTFFDVSGLAQPLTIIDRVEDMALVKKVDTSVIKTKNITTTTTNDASENITAVYNQWIQLANQKIKNTSLTVKSSRLIETTLYELAHEFNVQQNGYLNLAENVVSATFFVSQDKTDTTEQIVAKYGVNVSLPRDNVFFVGIVISYNNSTLVRGTDYEYVYSRYIKFLNANADYIGRAVDVSYSYATQKLTRNTDYTIDFTNGVIQFLKDFFSVYINYQYKVTTLDNNNKTLLTSADYTVDYTTSRIKFIKSAASYLGQSVEVAYQYLSTQTSQETTQQNIARLILNKPLSNAYGIDNTVVANCCLHGTLYAYVTKPFDQQTWSNKWLDEAEGTTLSANFDFNNYPIVVDNYNAITERWAIIFTSSTQFNLIGENLGVVLTGQGISADVAPVNPKTNQPYFLVNKNGLGGGWASGNVIRFNTFAASAPFWILQSIAQGNPTDSDFNFAIECRGDIDSANA